MKLSVEIRATAELCNTNLSEAAAELLAEELAGFDEVLIRGALARCRRELKGRLTCAEVLARLEDGRPTALEAWGRLVWDEDSPYSPTDEMAVAQGKCRPLYFGGDKVGARMLFIEEYNAEVQKSRAAKKPVAVTESLATPAIRPFESREERDRAYERNVLQTAPIPEEVRKLMAGAMKRIGDGEAVKEIAP